MLFSYPWHAIVIDLERNFKHKLQDSIWTLQFCHVHYLKLQAWIAETSVTISIPAAISTTSVTAAEEARQWRLVHHIADANVTGKSKRVETDGIFRLPSYRGQTKNAQRKNQSSIRSTSTPLSTPRTFRRTTSCIPYILFEAIILGQASKRTHTWSENLLQGSLHVQTSLDLCLDATTQLAPRIRCIWYWIREQTPISRKCRPPRVRARRRRVRRKTNPTGRRHTLQGWDMMYEIEKRLRWHVKILTLESMIIVLVRVLSTFEN